MKRLLLMGMVCAFAVCFFALPALNAADAPADGLKLDHFKADKNNLEVVFNHSTHKAVDCKECHHKWDGAGAIQGCAAAGCHDVFDKKDKSEKSYYLVIHSPKAKLSTCISCHKDTAGKDKDKKKQLTGCKKSACHP